MSLTEILRRAAALMREGTDPRWYAVADLLEGDAYLMEQTAFAEADWERANSVAVARAYLGEPA